MSLPIPVIWHGNAVEVPDDTPKEQIEAVIKAMEVYDPKAARATRDAILQGAADARAKGTPTIADLDARLKAIEMVLGL